jgi:hypothetical protein
MTSTSHPPFASALPLAVALLVASCAAADPAPETESVMLAGESPANDCERAVAARAERIRDHDPDGALREEADVFGRCSYAEFVVANAKMAEAYSYPGNGRTYVGRGCARLFSIYRGSRLCQTR